MSRTLDILNDKYFEWLCGLIGENRRPKSLSSRRLLIRLHDTTFRYLIPNDQNRAEDGIDLRYRFALEYGYSPDWVMDILHEPCSVLEMMIALSIRCEENIMDDPNIGDRTGQWFWGMIVNLGLGSMTDGRYDERMVDNIIDRFLNREYSPEGRGGLFTIRDCNLDLRDVEIWYQLCWYLDGIV